MLFANSVRRTGNWLLLMGWKSRALRGVRGSSLQPPEGGNQGSPLGLYWHGQAWGYSFLSSVRLGWIGLVWMFLSYKVPPHCPFGQTEQAFRWSFFPPAPIGVSDWLVSSALSMGYMRQKIQETQHCVILWSLGPEPFCLLFSSFQCLLMFILYIRSRIWSSPYGEE